LEWESSTGASLLLKTLKNARTNRRTGEAEFLQFGVYSADKIPSVSFKQ